jgi:small subunit ribosomal protein S14
MAKKSMIAREKRRVKLSAQAIGLNKRPRDESSCRVKRRCRRCGRPRSVYRRFALCRICLREAAMHGDVPGLSKSSW